MLNYKNNHLHIEQIALTEIANTYHTPTYVYSRNQILRNWHAFKQSLQPLDHLLCYAVKANSNVHILKLLSDSGAGFDIVSGGELARVLAAGADPNKIIFSGVGKTIAEIKSAIEAKIHCFNVESESELVRLQQLAQAYETTINIALRVNPNIDANTHAYIATGLAENKFGIPSSEVIALCQQIMTYKNLKLIGLACHLGSQLTTLSPVIDALLHLKHLFWQIKKLGITLQHLNLGGGLGIVYREEQPPTIQQYIAAIYQQWRDRSLKLILEPGRALVGNAGILLTKVEYIKSTPQKNFAIMDSGMTELIRPALYGATHPILPVLQRTHSARAYDMVGPVCESADFLGKNCTVAIEPGDLIAIDKCGAYGFTMSCHYNSRPRVAEVLVNENQQQLIRRRETNQDLFALETFL